jgi:hypothetical protein
MASGSKGRVEEQRPAVRIVVVEDNDGDVFLLEKALDGLNFPYRIIRSLEFIHLDQKEDLVGQAVSRVPQRG